MRRLAILGKLESAASPRVGDRGVARVGIPRRQSGQRGQGGARPWRGPDAMGHHAGDRQSPGFGETDLARAGLRRREPGTGYIVCGDSTVTAGDSVDAQRGHAGPMRNALYVPRPDAFVGLANEFRLGRSRATLLCVPRHISLIGNGRGGCRSAKKSLNAAEHSFAYLVQRARIAVRFAGERYESRVVPMRWAVLSGIGAAAMLALGFNMILPLGRVMDDLCDLAGVASAIVFLGLAEGA